MLPCFVMLDLETTGGSAVRDRITEIAAVRVEHGQEVARWSTLVNPGVPIPPFIESLTGISNAMVADAPTFAEVAPQLLTLLKDAVFVAHNVRFDYGFVQQELARLNQPLDVKTLCTVRLARRLYPQHKGHGLDALLQRHGLHTDARHRAMGDVDVVLQWLRLAEGELGAAAVEREAQGLLQGNASLPPLLETPLQDIPDAPGVYLFFGDDAKPLYIGKGKSIRTRVLSHFQGSSKPAREQQMLAALRRIECRETAGEMGALLLQARLVRDMQPRYNRKSQKKTQLDLVQQTLPRWPHTGRVAIREHHAATDRTDIHLFDQWCHVATVHSESELEEARTARSSPSFDLELYRVLEKRLAPPWGHDPAVFRLEPARG